MHFPAYFWLNVSKCKKKKKVSFCFIFCWIVLLLLRNFHLCFISPVSLEHFRDFLVLNFGSEDDAEMFEDQRRENKLGKVKCGLAGNLM